MMMVEARRSERVRSFLRARIIFNNHNSTIDCTIKNFSPQGAKIAIANTMSIPDSFDLEVPQKGRTYRARMTWRDETAIGVEFVEDSSTSLETPQAKIERLEHESQRLRATVTLLAKRLEDLGQVVSLS